MGPKEQIKVVLAAVPPGHLQNAAVLQPCPFPSLPFPVLRNEGNSQLSTQLYPFQSSPDTWEILLQPNSFTTAWRYPVLLEGLGAGSPTSTSHTAPLHVGAVEVKTPTPAAKESRLGCLPRSGQQRDSAQGWQRNNSPGLH